MEVSYLSHFNLKEEPFSTVPNPRYFFLSPIHATALGKTEFTVQVKKGLTLVFGDTGTGKSTLARLLHQKFLDQGFNSVLLTNPNYPTPNALLRSIVQEFGLQTARSYKDNLDIFKAFLITEAVNENRTVVLILDEAQTLRIPLLELMRQLLNFETNETKLIQLVLFAQDELRAKLQHPMARSFRSRIAMASTLEGIGREELRQLVDFRWRVASANQEHPFDPAAIEVLFDYSSGTPREACIIADNALLLAFLSNQRRITKEIMDSAARERAANVGRAPQKEVKRAA
jgi:type II secretory pathway predicted ATPase ExeA